MGYTFISFVGQQNLGVQNPLEACLQTKNSDNSTKFNIDKVILLPSEKTVTNADEIKKYGEENGYPSIEIILTKKGQDLSEVFDPLCSQYEKIIFNTDGGMNFSITYAIVKLFQKKDAYSVVSNTDSVKIFSLKNYEYENLPFPKSYPVEELLKKIDSNFKKVPQGVLSKFIKNGHIKLPKNSLTDIEVNGEVFDVIWNEGNNRLAFLSYKGDRINRTYPKTDAEKKEKKKQNSEYLKELRNLCKFASTKQGTKNQYDRKIYVLCPDDNRKDHVKLESRGKVTVLKVFGDRFNDDPIIKARLRKELNRLFSNNSAEKQLSEAEITTVNSDSLIVAMGTDPSSTVKAIYTHFYDHKIKNVILLISEGSDVQDLALNAKRFFEENDIDGQTLNVSIVQSDIDASNINSLLKKAAGSTNIQVNATPGTKGQNASMTFWATKNNCDVWTLDGKNLRCINNSLIPADKVYTGDILAVLEILYGDIGEYSKAIERNSNELQENSQFLTLLLKQIRYCYEANSQWNRFNGYKNGGIKEGGIKFTLNKKRIATLKDGDTEELSMDWSNGGEWFEMLTAQALINCDCKYVHARVRLPYSQEYLSKLKRMPDNIEDFFRVDMDVLASLEDSTFLISCKSCKIGEVFENAPVPEEVADEAIEMASAISRYVVPIVCYLDENDDDINFKGLKTIKSSEGESVTFITKKELCQEDKLKEILKNAAQERRTTKNSKKQQQ